MPHHQHHHPSNVPHYESHMSAADHHQHHEEHQSSTLTTVLACLFCMVAIILFVGILLAFTLGDSPDVITDDDYGSGGSSVEVGGTIVGTRPSSVLPRIETGLEQATTTGPQNKEPRSGKLLCVLGSNFAHGGVIVDHCDYLIYPDLIVSHGKFVPVYGNTSWEAFKQAVLVPRIDCVGGVSFSLNRLGEADSTVGRIPHMAGELANLVQMGVQVMGVLNFMRHTGGNTNTALNDALVALAKAVKGQPHAMVFLGVWLYNTKAVHEFVSEVMEMTSVDTIILQTHMSEPFFSGGPCKARPISLMSSTEDLPTFRHAEEAARMLKAGTDRFRILLSSVLGALFYRFHGGAAPVLDGQCKDATVVDNDVVCNIQEGAVNFDTVNMYQSVTFAQLSSGSGYIAFRETVLSLRDKMDLFVGSERTSEGWAVFEVQRDQAGLCAGATDYEHLIVISSKARYKAN